MAGTVQTDDYSEENVSCVVISDNSMDGNNVDYSLDLTFDDEMIQCKFKPKNIEPTVHEINAGAEKPTDETDKNIPKTEIQEKVDSAKTENSDSQENDIEEDDVPANFFDDLMNEDFIEGLNVVDAWDEDEIGKTNDLRNKLDIGRDLRQRIRNRKSPVRVRTAKRSKQGKAHKERNNKSSERKSTEKPFSLEEDARRDPNKTQRDILRDKDKRAKDRKAKIISERLMVVETGLVPPGTEMEIDLEAIKMKDKEEKKERKERNERRSRSDRRSRSLQKRRSASPRRAKYNTERRSPIKRYSRSPRRNSPKYVRNRSVERKWDDRKYDDRRRRSPVRGRRGRSSSLLSDVSDREKWLRRSKAMRDNTPVKRKVQSFLQELDDKLSQSNMKKMNEIQEKISGSMLHMNVHIPQPLNMPGNFLPGVVRPLMPGPVPPPMPVPNPNFQNTLVQQKYDQQFFIGQPDMSSSNNFIQPIGQRNFQDNLCPPHMMHQQLQTQMPYMMPNGPPAPMPVIQTPINPQLSTGAKLIIAKHNNNEKEVFMQLFADKKISLTDYLSLSAKYTDVTKPIDIQNKIKVITRSQDAIRELTGEGKFTGRFMLKRTMRSFEKPVETKNLSPFKRIPVVRFQFTTLMKQNDEKNTLTNNLNRLLVSIGIDPVFATVPKLSPVPPEVPKSAEVHNVQENRNLKRSKFVQTTASNCAECETRNKKKMVNMMTQTANFLSFDVACQVSAADFERPVRSILKNQSLASMTPAQLLAQNQRERSPTLSFSPPPDLRSPSPLGLPAKKTRMDINEMYSPEREFVQRNCDEERYSNRYRSANDFDIGNFERYKADSFDRQAPPEHNRSPYKSPGPIPFSNFSSRLNFVPPTLQGPSYSGSHRPIFEPPVQQYGNNSNYVPSRRY